MDAKADADRIGFAASIKRLEKRGGFAKRPLPSHQQVTGEPAWNPRRVIGEDITRELHLGMIPTLYITSLGVSYAVTSPYTLVDTASERGGEAYAQTDLFERRRFLEHGMKGLANRHRDGALCKLTACGSYAGAGREAPLNGDLVDLALLPVGAASRRESLAERTPERAAHGRGDGGRRAVVRPAATAANGFQRFKSACTW